MFGPDKDYLVDSIIRAIAELFAEPGNWQTNMEPMWTTVFFLCIAIVGVNVKIEMVWRRRCSQLSLQASRL
jgi:hypothetical protein